MYAVLTWIYKIIGGCKPVCFFFRIVSEEFQLFYKHQSTLYVQEPKDFLPKQDNVKRPQNQFEQSAATTPTTHFSPKSTTTDTCQNLSVSPFIHITKCSATQVLFVSSVPNLLFTTAYIHVTSFYYCFQVLYTNELNYYIKHTI